MTNETKEELEELMPLLNEKDGKYVLLPRKEYEKMVTYYMMTDGKSQRLYVSEEVDYDCQEQKSIDDYIRKKYWKRPDGTLLQASNYDLDENKAEIEKSKKFVGWDIVKRS